MATTLNKTYVWPPNFVEGTDTMGESTRRIKVRVSGTTSDGTADSGIQVIDKSDLKGPNGTEPSSLAVDSVEWNAGEMDVLVLEWDHSTNNEIYTLTGSDEVDWSCAGGLIDPKTNDGTGDIVVSSEGGASGSKFAFTICCRLKE